MNVAVVPETFTPLINWPVILVAFIKLPVIVAPLIVPVTVASVLTINALSVEVPVEFTVFNVV